MRKRIFLIMIMAVVALSLFACGDENKQAADNQTADNSSVGLDWPSEYMSSLPAPDSKISGIEKLNGTEPIPESDTTTPPSSVNIVMNEMTEKQALAYYDQLKNSGFTINTDEKDKEKLLLVGTLNDEHKNPFLFSYDFEYELGNVSITIMDAVYSGVTGDDAASDSGIE